MKHLFGVFFLVCILFPSAALAWPGTVVSVSDGDTVIVAPSGTDHSPVTVRLYGVDAPELGQAFGPEARDWLRCRLPVGQRVEVVPYDADQYGRSVALIQLDGRPLNGELVAAGFAWVYYPYCKAKFCRSWNKAQKQARQAKLGLWRDQKPVRPGDWRKKHPRR